MIVKREGFLLLGFLLLGFLTGCGLGVDAVETAHTLEAAHRVQQKLVAKFQNPTTLIATFASIEAAYSSPGARDYSDIGVRSKEFLGESSEFVYLSAVPNNHRPATSYAITFEELDSEQCEALVRPEIAALFKSATLNKAPLTKKNGCLDKNSLSFVSK